jgi:sec-independent protein translocase protein TatC
MAEATDDPFEHTRMTLGEHLEELRKRIFKSALVLAIAFGFAWWQTEPIAAWVMSPWGTAVGRINADLVQKAEKTLAAHPEMKRAELFESDDPHDTRLKNRIDPRLQAFAVGDPFFFAMNNAIYFALFVGSPFVLWQLWQFVAAGLYRHEKRLISLYFPFSALLFLTGVAFCFYLVVPVGLYFLATTVSLDKVRPMLGLDQYFTFLSTMCLAMGLVFQLPIVMIFVSRIGIVDPRTYSKYRGHFLIGALFMAALLTPGPDWYSQVLMTIPMLLLYEIGAWIARLTARPRRHEGRRPGGAR